MSRKCKICGSINLKVKHDKIRNNTALEDCNVLECLFCGVVFLDLDVEQEALKDYYKQGHFRNNYLPNAADENSKDAEKFYQIKQPLQEKRYEIVKDIFCPGMEILDVGCATGGFLNILKNKVKRVKGVELYKPHVDFVNQKLGIECEVKDIKEIRGEAFDVICIFHVLEHVADPVDFTSECFRRIKDKGCFIIEVPNLSDALISIFDITPYKNFHFMKPHLFYFCEKSLEFLLKKAGFRDVIFRSYQHYGIINHLSWVLAGETSSMTKMGGAGVELPSKFMGNNPQLDIFGEFIQEMNAKYKKLLESKQKTDTLLAIARK